MGGLLSYPIVQYSSVTESYNMETTMRSCLSARRSQGIARCAVTGDYASGMMVDKPSDPCITIYPVLQVKSSTRREKQSETAKRIGITLFPQHDASRIKYGTVDT